MKRAVKVLVGLFAFILFVLNFNLNIFASDVFNVSEMTPGRNLGSKDIKIYNDTQSTIYYSSADISATVYISRTTGERAVAPGETSGYIRYGGGFGNIVVGSNEAYGFHITIKYGNGQDDTKQYVFSGETMVEPEDPVWDGHDFLGWYMDPEYKEKFDFATSIDREYTLYAKWREKSSGEIVPFREASSYVDHDTFKSEMPSKTILVAGKADEKDFMDMKIHATYSTNNINQIFLAKQLVGNNAEELITRDIFPRRNLSITEDGEKKILIWNNLDIRTTGIVKAVVYNQTDGAYVINGVSDGSGTVRFIDFILRPASTITVIAP